MKFNTEAPEVGSYENLDIEVYNRAKCARASTLGAMARGELPTPAHVKAATAGSSTGSTSVGSAMHLALFEPERYQSDVEIWTSTKTRGVAFKKREAELTDAQFLLTGDEAAKIAPMVANVHRCTRAVSLLDACEVHELSVVFHLETLANVVDDGPEESGAEEWLKLLCRARLDGLAPSMSSVVDLKTTQSASRRDFTRSIYKYGYHYQAAIYRLAAEAAGYAPRHHVIIAVENTYPHYVACYRIADSLIKKAMDELQEPIAALARAYDTGIWGAYPDVITDIGADS